MYVSHPLVKPNTVKLRRYQESVVSRAIESNTLVVLPTGLGKTMIAAMVSAHRLMKHPDSRILFLAPTKPLVLQHRRAFSEILTTQETVVLTGQDKIEDRARLFLESRIIFATPQTIENDLMRGTLDLKDVSLLVFDEAHRATGHYSYRHIAGEYVKKAVNPLILGLTASPSSDSERVREICSNLFIKQIEAKTEHDVDVKPYIQEVHTEWVKVDLPQEFLKVKVMIEDLVRDDLRMLKASDYLESSDLRKMNKRILLELQSKIRKEISSGIDSFAQASVVARILKLNHALELLETQGISALDSYFQRLSSQKAKGVRKLMGDERMQEVIKIVHDLRVLGVEHPKLDRLVEVVREHPKEKILIFTQYRDSVGKIIDRLNEADILAHEFVGQAHKDAARGMSQKEQSAVLEKFRAGGYNALICTSVAEEGLDIPNVDLVVFYEPIPSEVRSIQRRGRTGRSATGKVVVLMAKNTRDEGYYWASIHKERRMSDIVRKMRGGDETLLSGESAEETTGEKKAGQQTIVQYNTTGGNAPQEDKKIKIYVDARERNSRIMEILKERGINFEVRQLEVGDYILSDRVCVERKTVSDFLQSIIDKRLFDQAAELKRNFSIPIIVLEGDGGLYSQRDIHPNAIRGALASLAVDYSISIIPTADDEDTASMIQIIAKREQEDEERIVALRGEKRAVTLSEKQQFVIESLPNVSGVLAQRLLRHFGSVQKIVDASESDLMRVEGIGEKKAEEIRRIVKSKYNP